MRVNRGWVVLLAAISTGCVSHTSAPPRRAAAPWLDRPAPAYTAPPVRWLPYPTAAPVCRARQLRATVGRGAVGLGNVLRRFVFRNTGATACLAAGFAVVEVRTRHGGHVRLQARRSPLGTYFGRIVPADIPPGHT